MADCSKGLSELTHYETYRCFVEADTWKIIGRNLDRMRSDFAGTTIGEWDGIVFAFALLPAQWASYIPPFYFLFRLAMRFGSRGAMEFDEKECRLRTGWGMYLIVAGAALVGLSYYDRFMLMQGMWEILCGITIFVLGPSWWVSKPKSARRPSASF